MTTTIHLGYLAPLLVGVAAYGAGCSMLRHSHTGVETAIGCVLSAAGTVTITLCILWSVS